MKFDALGSRMKENYENRTRIQLPRRTYTIIRIDGKAFHTYTRGLQRPFDEGLIADMDETAIYLCKNIQGAKFGFVQSDEISILVTDFDTLTTDAWFDGNIQKIVSISASMATAKFNQLRMTRIIKNSIRVEGDGIVHITPYEKEILNMKLAEFDARTFTIPSSTEVANYMIWRQVDTVRNSISSVAQSLYSAKELHGKNTNDMQEMIFQKGINWNDYDPKYKRGRFIFKQEYEVVPDIKLPEGTPQPDCFSTVIRSRWVSDECPTFTQDMEFLYGFIPEME
jgi:tRNA(His) 5'-end guanylyltransferase